MKTTFIYVLKEPETGKIRYVGKSNDPKRRLRDHFNEKNNNHKACWLKSLVLRGQFPVLEIVDEVSMETWPMVEAAYIQFYREDEGCALVNTLAGGEGGPIQQGPLSKETRNKIGMFHRGNQWKKGVKLSKDSLIRLSAAKTGVKHPFYGKRLSEMHKQNIALALKGNHNGKGRKARYRREDVLALLSQGKTQSEVGKVFGVTQSAISHFLCVRNLKSS